MVPFRRATIMRLGIAAMAITLLLRALLFDRADLPSAIGIGIAALAYECFYRMASAFVRANAAVSAPPVRSRPASPASPTPPLRR